MLKGIPAIINSNLLKALNDMGHGDEIVICDANCPANKYVKECLRCDVTSAPELVEAILQLIPLDTYEHSVYMMKKVDGDDDIPTANWDEYYAIIKNHSSVKPEHMERFAFYEKMRNASVALITADIRPYGNIILKKGVFSK